MTTQTNQSLRIATMSIEEIGALLEREGISSKKFWQLAMGGDMRALPASVVQSVIDENESSLRE